MQKDNKYFFPITLILFLLVELFLLKSQLQVVGILIYLVYSALLYFINKKYLIAFFVFNLPLYPIIPTDYKIFSIGPHEVIYGFSFITLLYYNNKAKYTKFSEYQKVSTYFSYFLFIIVMYILIKDILFDLETETKKTTLMYVFKNFFRKFLYYSSLVLLIKNMAYDKIYSHAIIGIQCSVVFLVFSMFFTKELILIGAEIAKKELFLEKSAGNYERYIGFFGTGGDENSVGVFLASFFGFILALYEKNKKSIYVVLMGFAIFGVLLTGSRTSFIALSLILIMFLMYNKSVKVKFYILISLVVFVFLFGHQLQLLIDRFYEDSATHAIDSEKMGRVGKWIYYINWIYNNPETILIGNQKSIPYNRAPHNYLIYLLYHAGIFFLFYFVYIFVKLINLINFKVKPYDLRNIYFILPYPFLVMTVNSVNAMVYLFLYLSVAVVYSRELSQSN